MKREIAGLMTFLVLAFLAVALVLGAAGRARAGELVSDKVVDSLLLRAKRAQEPVVREGPEAPEGFSLAPDKGRKPVQGSFLNLGKLKSFGVAALILGGLALLAFGAWKNGWRLRPSGSASTPIRLVSTKPLGDKKAIAVVDVEGQRLVVGMTTHQVTLLTALPGRNEGFEDYTLEDSREPAEQMGSRWAPPETNLDFGGGGYPDIQGIMAAMRG